MFHEIADPKMTTPTDGKTAITLRIGDQGKTGATRRLSCLDGIVRLTVGLDFMARRWDDRKVALV